MLRTTTDSFLKIVLGRKDFGKGVFPFSNLRCQRVLEGFMKHALNGTPLILHDGIPIIKKPVH